MDGLKEAVLGGLEEVTVPGEVLEAQHLALQQSIVKHKPSLLETISYTIEKLLVIESEANLNHSCLFGRHRSVLRTSCRFLESESIHLESNQFKLC